MTNSSEQRFRVLILGAGFSVPAGMPLGIELWREVLRRASSLEGGAERFHHDVEVYLEFRRQCYGEQLTPESLDFEDFLAFLDVEYHLGLRGSGTWSQDGNEGQVVVKTLIAEILAERMPAAHKLPDVYYRFAEGLQSGDCVLRRLPKAITPKTDEAVADIQIPHETRCGFTSIQMYATRGAIPATRVKEVVKNLVELLRRFTPEDRFPEVVRELGILAPNAAAPACDSAE